MSPGKDNNSFNNYNNSGGISNNKIICLENVLSIGSQRVSFEQYIFPFLSFLFVVV